MDDNGRFGFDPEDFDRVIRDASEGLARRDRRSQPVFHRAR